MNGKVTTDLGGRQRVRMVQPARVRVGAIEQELQPGAVVTLPEGEAERLVAKGEAERLPTASIVRKGDGIARHLHQETSR